MFFFFHIQQGFQSTPFGIDGGISQGHSIGGMSHGRGQEFFTFLLRVFSPRSSVFVSFWPPYCSSRSYACLRPFIFATVTSRAKSEVFVGSERLSCLGKLLLRRAYRPAVHILAIPSVRAITRYPPPLMNAAVILRRRSTDGSLLPFHGWMPPKKGTRMSTSTCTRRVRGWVALCWNGRLRF